ncbi:VUT family protein [Ahrensia marina]|uniref:Probable queuosine precursor transporter n=1 Tax=Ahrensia marina TaxID=1514904 RepID=A0A0N0E775_9HYPH|nr:VUT family protein [Ahrensia marina]KPB00865.1 membrane protein [Ahrensia marina]
MLISKNTSLFILAMCAVVVASNFLVQFPVQAHLGAINLADLLTWGAFTYPMAFLVTDLTNRRFGKSQARVVVFSGFILAVVLSIWLATPRIAIASGSAFLLAQLLDVSIFDRLRASQWWKAPLISTVLGSILDTILFFGIAFAPVFGFLDFGGQDGSLGFAVPFLGIGAQVPLWISLAVGDFIVKIFVGVAMLFPYRLFVRSPAAA